MTAELTAYFLESSNGTKLFVEGNTGHAVGSNSECELNDLSPIVLYKIELICAAFLFSSNIICREIIVVGDTLKAPVLSYSTESLGVASNFSLRHPSTKLFLSVEPPPMYSLVSCSRNDAREWESFRAVNAIDESTYSSVKPLLNAINESCRSHGLLGEADRVYKKQDDSLNADVIGAVRRLGFSSNHRFSWRRADSV